jgi:pyroglutamyl-peptidase
VPTLLLTGFEPFNGGSINPSGEVAQRLDGSAIAGARVIGRVLPVSFARLPAALAALIDTVAPDALLGMGLAGGEAAIRLEQVAINRAHSEAADNDGLAPANAPLDPAGPAARLATLALEPAIARLRAADLPARLSFHAGTHCCNLWLYHALGVLERRGGAIPCGFIHLPCLPEQVLDGVQASMPLDRMIQAVRLVAEAALASAPLANAPAPGAPRPRAAGRATAS